MRKTITYVGGESLGTWQGDISISGGVRMKEVENRVHHDTIMMRVNTYTITEWIEGEAKATITVEPRTPDELCRDISKCEEHLMSLLRAKAAPSVVDPYKVMLDQLGYR